MGTETNFQQILESKIKMAGNPPPSHEGGRQGFNTSASPLSTPEPAHLAYLLGHIGQTFFRPPPSLQVHKSYPSRPMPPAPPARPPHSFSEDQALAYAFFALYEGHLSPAFSQKELKKAFRTLALKLHPDMNKGAAGAFIELKNHYVKLLELFN